MGYHPVRLDGGGGRPIIAAREMLILLGGLLAMVLGPLFFLLELALEGIGLRGLSAVIVDVVIGGLLLASVPLIRRRAANGIPLALISSIILIVLGGTGGVVGGLFGLVGTALAVLSRYRTFLQ